MDFKNAFRALTGKPTDKETALSGVVESLRVVAENAFADVVAIEEDEGFTIMDLHEQLSLQQPQEGFYQPSDEFLESLDKQRKKNSA